MKIIINPEIKNVINEIENVWLEISFSPSSELNTTAVDIDYIKKFNYLEMADSAFKQCKAIQYRVQNKTGDTKVYKFQTKHKAKYSNCKIKPLGVQTKKSKVSKKHFFSTVSKNILNAKNANNTPLGTKNLIYYSVYFNGEYLTLLNLSAESLISFGACSFDILIITDKETKKHIEALPFARKITPLFHITDTPTSGVEASINKLEIFNYKHINKYKKILYLDADIIASKPIKNLFKQKHDVEIFYTASNTHLTHEHFKTPQHGFVTLSNSFVKEMRANNQMPFNAGQFFFYNTEQMKVHFNNVMWMINNWNGDYFFEQCFMNYYFCKACVTNNKILNDVVSFVVTTDTNPENIKLDKPLTHFIAPPLNGNAKVNFINKILNSHNIH